MSHASYHFLVPTAKPTEAVATFEVWAKDHCDENNWWTVLEFISAKGVRTYLNKEYQDNLGPKTAHQKARGVATDRANGFADATHFALACVMFELHEAVQFCSTRYELRKAPFFSPEYYQRRTVRKDAIALTTEQYLHRIQHRYPKLLARRIRQPISPEAFKEYELQRALMIYAHLRQSIAKQHCPFTTDDTASPYTYRAFDLADGGPALGILHVDIHT